ncbi:MAG: argininosuccinate synthase [Cyclobacteriaceae bacterium]|nr:argininosuccinate synthase [Cyclobacteriaceae bacterium]
MSKKTVVLAYSGGLDTSYCVKYLTEDRGYEVHSVLIDTGGFSSDELKLVEERAHAMGVEHHENILATNDYYQNCIKYMIFGNTLRNNTYPLSVSAERVFQAKFIAEYAKKIGADAVAHGSTGAGNDQVRFDMIFHIMIPEVEIITPIRDLQLSREDEIDYLKSKGVEMDWSKTQYSINQGIWGTSVGGKETLTSDQYLPNESFPSQCKKEGEQLIKLKFKKGELVGLDDESFENPVDAIQKLNAIASEYAIGRDIHVGDTIIGIKGRVGFEAAAPIIIIKAHHLLEKHVLTKWQQYWKEQLGNWYGMLVHEGQFMEPVLRNVEKFLEDTQQHVTGEAIVKLEPFRFTVQGVNSSYDLMSSEFGVYGEMHKGFTGEDVKGFSRILSNQVMIYNKVKEKNEQS